jgi:hypothetical protein
MMPAFLWSGLPVSVNGSVGFECVSYFSDNKTIYGHVPDDMDPKKFTIPLTAYQGSTETTTEMAMMPAFLWSGLPVSVNGSVGFECVSEALIPISRTTRLFTGTFQTTWIPKSSPYLLLHIKGRLRITTNGTTTEMAMMPAFLWSGLPVSVNGSVGFECGQ